MNDHTGQENGGADGSDDGGSAARGDAANYIRAMITPLHKLATEHSLEVLAYLLTMAIEEATQHAVNSSGTAPRAPRQT